MAKRQNYGFQKRQKEAEKQRKRAAKAEKKRARRESGDESGSNGGDDESDEESDEDESEIERATRGARPGRLNPRPAQHGRALAAALVAAGLDATLQRRLRELFDEGDELWDRFDRAVRRQAFHPFVAADYDVVLEALLPLRAPGLRFLEWGSATGVITIMADLLGFEACGIEIDARLVDQARELARRFDSDARFVAGSFLPTGYEWGGQGGDRRLGTVATGESGYLELGMALEDFDVVFGYPWGGEEPIMLDLMRAHGRGDAAFLLLAGDGVRVYRGGRLRAGV